MRKLLRCGVLGVVLAVLMPQPADAQVYPERVGVKERAIVVYQRRARDDNREEQTERTTKAFKLGSDGSIDVQNISGDITVTRGGGSDATVEIVKTARGRDASDARTALGAVTVDITEGTGHAELRTHYANQMHGNMNVSVTYNIAAPAGTRVSANSMSGDIKITDIKGDVSANTINGDIRISGASRVNTAHSVSGNVEIADVKTDGSIETSTVSGDVKLRHITARRVNGVTVSGEVHLEDITSDTVSAHTINGEIQFSGTLAPHGTYKFTTNSGDVRLTLSGSTGFEVDANSFSGDIRCDFPVTARSTGGMGGRAGRRTVLRGTYGDGSAVLQITTFNGSVVIARK